jgi:hypothetical protein
MASAKKHKSTSRATMQITYYALVHIRDFNNRAGTAKLVGIFSSADAAKKAIQRRLGLPGFRDYPKNYVIEPLQVDHIRYSDGFPVK